MVFYKLNVSICEKQWIKTNSMLKYHPIGIALFCIEKKEEIWLSPVTKAPTLTEKSIKQRDNIKNATKTFDYTTIAGWLRTVSCSNSSHPTGVVI